MNRLRLVLLMIVIAATLSGCSQQVAVVEPEFVFRYAENQAVDFPTTQAGQYFSDLVKARTDGRIEILVYADEALGDERSVIEQLQFGGIDFSRLNLSPMAELDARYYALQLPYLYESGEHMWRVLDGEIGADYLGIAEKLGLRGLAWVDAGARSFYSRAPIHNLQDIEGLSIRVQENRLMERLVESFGARSQKLRYGMVLAALQTGEIDSAENNIPSYLSMGHYLIARYFLEDEHTRIPEMIVASAVTMDKLSDADRRIIEQAAREVGLYQRKLWSEYERHAREQLIAAGCTINALSPEARGALVEAADAVYDEFLVTQSDIETVDKIRALAADKP